MNVALIGFSLVAAVALQYGYQRASDIRRVELGRNLTPLAEGTEAGERVLNILLVGTDSSAGLDPTDPVQIGRQGERFGDTIIIAHVDERTRQLALLSIPRDLWLPLVGTNRSDRINRAFQLGGPAMLIDTIESTLNLPIHHYVNVDFAGFQGLVEAVGSVEVYFETPARDWNVNAKPEPRSQTGFYVGESGCHALDPPTALAYVRSRFYQTQQPDGSWVTDPRSDFGRISRQQDFLQRLMQRAIDLGARNPFVLKDLIDAGLANVAIDDRLTPQLLLDVGTAYRSFDPTQLQTYSFPVVDAVIDGNQVLQPQWVEAEPLLALMRGAPFDDPATVRLSVVAPINPPAEIAQAKTVLVDGFHASGYLVEEHALSDVEPGVAIHHGPDGQAAGAQVAAVLSAMKAPVPIGPEIPVVQVDGLKGRSVQIRLGPPTPEERQSSGAQEGDQPSSGQSNSAQDQRQSDLIRKENPTTTTIGSMDGAGASPTLGTSTSSLDGREAERQVTVADGRDATEAACRS